MAKGSVRKKGKKWYYRFYVEDESGRQVQKEFVGTESKSETEALLRKAMEDYETTKFVAKSENLTLGGLFDLYVEESLKPSGLSNGTVSLYVETINLIKKNPIANRKLKNVTADHLQKYVDTLVFDKHLSVGSMRAYSAVLNNSFKFAVFPKKLIMLNPMQYVVIRTVSDNADLFSDEDDTSSVPTITHKQYESIIDYLTKKNNPVKLAIQIAYYTGLRLGEVCGLTWQDINLDEQYLTVRRSVRYNKTRHKLEIGTTKRNKIRTVDFCDTLAGILKKAKKQQAENRLRYGEFYSKNYYTIVTEKNRKHYELYSYQLTDVVPEGYNEISLVCTKLDGACIQPSSIESICKTLRKKVDGLDDFHFHTLRHTYTSNMLSNGAAPKDVQELLGHSDVNTTMNVYAHSTRQSKHKSAMLLDKVVS